MFQKVIIYRTAKDQFLLYKYKRAHAVEELKFPYTKLCNIVLINNRTLDHILKIIWANDLRNTSDPKLRDYLL